MLFAVVGAIWTISILCMTFVGLYFYTLHNSQGVSLNYVWDKYRLLMLYILGLAVFYLGTARLVSTLSALLMSRLNQGAVPLWYSDRWLTLAAICAVVAFMIGLLNRGERIEDLHLEADLDNQLILPEIRALPAPVIRPEDATTYLHSVTKPLAPINVLDNEPVVWDGFWTTFRHNAMPTFLTLLGICVLTITSWLVFNKSDFLPGINPARPIITLAESSQPIIPEIDQALLDIVVDANLVNTDFVIAAKPTENSPLPLARSSIAAIGAGGDMLESAIVSAAPIVVEPTASESLSGLTAVYTSAIPITLVTELSVEATAEAVETVSVKTVPVAKPVNRIPIAVVQGSFSVNARFSPSTESAIIKVLPSGTTVPIREWSPNREWLLVTLDDGRSAWVAARVVEIATIIS